MIALTLLLGLKTPHPPCRCPAYYLSRYLKGQLSIPPTVVDIIECRIVSCRISLTRTPTVPIWAVSIKHCVGAAYLHSFYTRDMLSLPLNQSVRAKPPRLKVTRPRVAIFWGAMVIKVVTSAAAFLAAGMAFAANFSSNILPTSPLTVVSAPIPAPTSVAVSDAGTQWVNCAAEGQSCAASGTVLVRYGVGSTFVTKEVTGRFICGNDLFGDPVQGIVKSCSYSILPSAPQWIACASENQTCILPGSAQVRYGALGTFATRDATNRIVCNNAVFGDPIQGIVKSCFYRAAGAAQDNTASVELPAIASNFDVNQYLVPSWGRGDIPASGAPDVVGAFRFICNPGQLLADDPIVYPGQPGRSHLHQFFGNTAANANSSYASLRTSGESTCNNMLNRSAYWIPAMMNGRGKVVRPDYISIYYKRRAVNDPECLRMAAKGCRD
ncbi:MAG: DUF1996 domain-containing protein, partial [Oxalobacteraceae bacterium]